jgi:hypothetical protein
VGKRKKAKGLSANATGALYQIAGQVTIGRDSLTEGQRTRLEQLLLDVLADPDEYSTKRINDLYAIAMEP